MEDPDPVPIGAGAPAHAASAGFFRWSDEVTAGHRAVVIGDEQIPSVRFGHYNLIGCLGRGGMARIYLAVREEEPEVDYAVKVLNAELSRQQKAREQFYAEARLSQLLVHRNIVRAVDYGEIGGRAFLAMKRVHGWDLEGLLADMVAADEEIPEPVIIEIALGIGRAMAYAHGMHDRDGNHLRLVHRDLKPGNVMVDPRGEVVVMDFGIARWRHRAVTTSQDWVKGTVGYMSPEQVMGTYLTARSDSFALGSLIAALAIGSPPFARDSLESSGKAIVEGDLDPVWPRLVARLPLLSSLVARCVRTRPSERPSSSGIVAELEALAEVSPPGALQRWLGQVEPQLWPPPGPGHWPQGGPPEGLRRTHRQAGLTPSGEPKPTGRSEGQESEG